MIITLDGLAGTGKTTISKYFANHYIIINPKTNVSENILYMSSGEFYRIITLCASVLQPANVMLHTSQKNPIEDYSENPPKKTEKIIVQLKDNIKKHYKKFTQSIDWDTKGIKSSLLESYYKSHSEFVLALYSPKISLFSAHIASYGPLREILNDKMRSILRSGTHWIVEGRDAGSNIVQNPTLQVYLEANIKLRVERRTAQYRADMPCQRVGNKKTQEKITERDYLDTHRGEYSIKKDTNAFYIDTSFYTIEQVCEKLYNKIQQTTYKICRR